MVETSISIFMGAPFLYIPPSIPYPQEKKLSVFIPFPTVISWLSFPSFNFYLVPMPHFYHLFAQFFQYDEISSYIGQPNVLDSASGELSKYLLSTYCVAGSSLDVWAASVNKTNYESLWILRGLRQ